MISIDVESINLSPVDFDITVEQKNLIYDMDTNI